MPIGAIIGAGASLAGGAMQAGAAKSAAAAQERAAAEQIALQREIYGDQTRRFEPFYQGGQNALSAYLYEMGLGDRPMVGATMPEIIELGGGQSQAPAPMAPGGIDQNPADQWGQRQTQGSVTQSPTGFQVGGRTFATRAEAETYARQNMTGGTQYQGITMSPGGQFALQQGIGDVEAGASMRGGLRSGATMAGLERLRFGLSAQDRDNQLNRLAGLVDMGQGSAGMQAQAGNAFAGMASTSLANRGDAQAAGHIGAGNAYGNALGNLAGIFAYQNQQGKPGGGIFG